MFYAMGLECVLEFYISNKLPNTTMLIFHNSHLEHSILKQNVIDQVIIYSCCLNSRYRNGKREREQEKEQEKRYIWLTTKNGTTLSW